MMRNLGRDSSRRSGQNLSDSDENSPLDHHNLKATLPRFKMPPLKRYTRSGDPDNHLLKYKTVMRLHRATKPLMCMAFPTTLRKPAKDWFNSSPPTSIQSFKYLTYAFCNQFALSKKKKNSTQLLSVIHGKKKTLHDDIHWFNLERLEVGDCSDGVTMATFTAGLKYKNLIKSIYTKPP